MTSRLPDVLMYHYVRDAAARPPVGYRSMDLGTFEAQLDDVCRHRTPVGWPQVRAALAGGPLLPPDAVLLTFDDGLADHHRFVMPRLAARGIPGLFFVLARRPADSLALGHRLHVLIAALGPHGLAEAVRERLGRADRARYAALWAATAARRPADPDDAWKRPLQRELAAAVTPVLGALVAEHLGAEDELAAELYLGERDLAELRSAGMTLGGHGFDHPWLDHVAPAIVRAELAASARLLVAYEAEPWAFAYPYGGVPAGASGLLQAAGFEAAFTTDPADRTSRFRIGRFDADELGPDPAAAMAALR